MFSLPAMKGSILMLAFSILVGVSAQVSALPLLSVEATPDRINGRLPGLVTVQVGISGLQDNTANTLLGAFQFDLLYDPTFLYFSSGAPGGFGTGLGNVHSGEANTNISFSDIGNFKVITFSEVSFLESDRATCVFCTEPYLEGLQPASFDLLTVSFHTLPQSDFPGGGLGNLVTYVVVRDIILSDSFGNELAVGRPIVFDSITFVPEPSSIALLIIGLLAFIWGNRGYGEIGEIGGEIGGGNRGGK